MDKAIVTCALTGVLTDPARYPVPVTAKEMADEARRAFEACLAREADHVEANFNLANVLEEEGEDHGALAHYRRALTADPFYPDLHINLALLYEKLDRMRAACRHWRRYLQIDPQGSWANVARQRLARESEQA